MLSFYERIKNEYSNIKVITCSERINHSKICNFAAANCDGEYLLFLNVEAEIITPEWMEEMLMYAQRKDVGAVGALLYYPNDTIRHAGIILGLGKLADEAFRNTKRGEFGYGGKLSYARNVSAVAKECVMIRKDVWDNAGGFDDAFAVTLNDVDFCMRIRKAGYLVVWTPFAELYLYDSKNMDYENVQEMIKRFNAEVSLFKNRWAKELKEGDPYYNPNLSLVSSFVPNDEK